MCSAEPISSEMLWGEQAEAEQNICMECPFFDAGRFECAMDASTCQRLIGRIEERSGYEAGV